MKKVITLPLSEEDIKELRAGDKVYLTGILYTARDAAHKRMEETILEGKQLPFSIEGSCIYYMGPSPARDMRPIGSAGPTTSSRMDKYTPDLLDLGLKGIIGKGKRSDKVKASLKKNKSIYFAAVGGAGALLSKCIISSKIIAYEDLGTEAVRELQVEDFPVIVAVDCLGNDIYLSEKEKYNTL